jgi:hypothetical protein
MRCHVRFAPAIILVLAAAPLAGCNGMTLEEARALCAKEGGLLTVFFTQELTPSGLGPVKQSPGDCIHREALGAPAVAPAPAAP